MSQPEEPLVIVGAWARVDQAAGSGVRRHLNELEGVSTFELDDPHKLGILIEAASIDDAHRTLRQDVGAVEGVLGIWPASIEIDAGDPAAEQGAQEK